MSIIDCIAIRDKEIERLKEEIKGEEIRAVFMQVGNNSASNIYVKNKLNLCKEIGIEGLHYQYDENITEEELVKAIRDLNKNKYIHGIMVQLPLPPHISEERIIDEIEPSKDLDGFTTANKGKLMVGDKSAIVPCTPQAIIDILDYEKINLEGAVVTVVGRSNIVGKPLVNLLINKGATVTCCNSKTAEDDLKGFITTSDVFISAIGRANHFNEDFFSYEYLGGTTAIDVGINRDEYGKLCGDIDRELYEEFEAVTPVPKGVGVLTVLNVIKNIIKCYNLQNN